MKKLLALCLSLLLCAGCGKLPANTLSPLALDEKEARLAELLQTDDGTQLLSFSAEDAKRVKFSIYVLSNTGWQKKRDAALALTTSSGRLALRYDPLTKLLSARVQTKTDGSAFTSQPSAAPTGGVLDFLSGLGEAITAEALAGVASAKGQLAGENPIVLGQEIPVQLIIFSDAAIPSPAPSKYFTPEELQGHRAVFAVTVTFSADAAV